MNKVICADYSFTKLNIGGIWQSHLDDNTDNGYGKHRIAYTEIAADGIEYVRFVEFVGYLRNMPLEFEQLYNLPEHVWIASNVRGLAKSKNVVNRVAYFRLSSMTEGE